MLIGETFDCLVLKMCSWRDRSDGIVRFVRFGWEQVNNFNQMEVFEANMNTVLKALLRLSELHVTLFQLSNLKIINCEELSQSPYIHDELSQARIELHPLKAEVETVSEQAKEVIDRAPTLPLHRQQQQAILSRMITRALEAVSNSPCKEELEYYQYYNQKFRLKCSRILGEIGHWEVFEVVWVLYKYFRHVALIELERYEEILECMTQTDFESVKYFRDYFYNMLKTKEGKEKEAKRQVLKDQKPQSQKQDQLRPNSQNIIVSSPLIPLPVPIQQQTHTQIYSQRSIDPSKLHETPKLQGYPQQNETQTQTPNLLTIPPLIPSPVQGKGKSNMKSVKKLFSMLSSVMDIKRDHFVVDCSDKKWEERSLYSDLTGRNKINHQQIQEYYHYSQLMADKINSTDGFYYYQEETLLPDEEQPSPERKRTKVHIPNDQYKKFLSCEPTRKQPSPQLFNPLQKRRQHRTVHKSINCRPRGQHPNAEIEQKPLKFDSQFLEINLKKVLPTRRQSQMEQMVIKASSLNNLRHDLHHKRVQVATDNAVKANNEVFKSVKILHHQNEVDAKALKEVKERAGHSRINSWINEQLKQNDYFSGKPDEVRKRMAFKKLDM